MHTHPTINTNSQTGYVPDISLNIYQQPAEVGVISVLQMSNREVQWLAQNHTTYCSLYSS